jgi:Na+/H+ antiporter NhaD/arsenite permease-like protein
MIPVIKQLNTILGITSPVLYWALSLGGCLGGNGTLVGASANIVVASIAEKNGYNISFRYYFKRGMPVMIVTVVLATIYLLIFY